MAEIAPGSSAKVTVIYNSAYDPVVKPGKRVLKTVEVWTNDPDKRMIILALQGLVMEHGKPRIWIEKTDHDFGTVKQGSIVRHDFRLKNAGDGLLLIKDVVRS